MNSYCSIRSCLKYLVTKMVSSSSPNSHLRYLSFESISSHPDESTPGRYYPVNIYGTNTISRSSKKHICLKYLCCIFCCKAIRDEDPNSTINDFQPSLVRPISTKKYTLQREEQRQDPQAHQHTPTLIASRQLHSQAPKVTVTEAIDHDISKSTTKLLLSTEKISSSVSQSTPKFNTIKRAIQTTLNEPANSPKNSVNNSRSSTLKSGEKTSFIHEILECRDSFLKSLEWFDNSLTRGKKCRPVKRDEWIELRNDSGII